MSQIIPLAVVALVTWILLGVLVSTVRSPSRRSDWLRVLTGIRPWMLLAAPAGIAVTIAVLIALMQVPILTWGWWSALGGTGNVILGQTAPQDDAPWGGSVLRFASIAVPALLLLLVPTLALAEERDHRRGTWSFGPGRVFLASLRFGLIHLVMGIPIAAGLALTVGGLCFHLVYRRAWSRHLQQSATPTPYSNLCVGEKRDRRIQPAHLRQEADTHGVYVAASFHALWNILLVVLVLGLAVSHSILS